MQLAEFYEPEGLLPWSQEPATGPYPEMCLKRNL
jgi:hypothetical protein